MKILIILPNWIGDVIMSLPFLEKSREVFKDSKIKILIKKDIYPLIEENCKTLDISPIFYTKKNFISSLQLIKKLKKENFNIAFILPRSYRMFLITLFSKIEKLYGYADVIKKFFYCKSLKRNNKSISQHRVYYYLDILKLYKNFNNIIRPQLKISNKNKLWADNFIKKHKINNKIIIGINPGATYGEAKCWKKDNYINLINKLKSIKNNFYFIVFGGKDNINYNFAFNNIKDCLNLTGKLTIDKSAALIDKCNIFITNDTGPMHIADALNIDIIAIFGPTDPNETPPFTKRDYLLYKKLPCSPCKKRECPENTNKCMELITVDNVIECVKKILKIKGASNA